MTTGTDNDTLARFKYLYFNYNRKQHEEHVRSEVGHGVHYSSGSSAPSNTGPVKHLLTEEEEKAQIKANQKKLMNKLHDSQFDESEREKERREKAEQEKKQHELAEIQRKLMSKMSSPRGGH